MTLKLPIRSTHPAIPVFEPKLQGRGFEPLPGTAAATDNKRDS